jgi:glycosyltransferase involved in cell wall biosynthesis
MSLISVVMASYNQGEFLSEAIESVLAQSYPCYEIVLVDDGSTDVTSTVAKCYPMVRYILQPHQGLHAARNRGLQEARGEYLVILDADDRLLPHHLAQSLQAFTDHPEAAGVCGNYRIIGDVEYAHRHRCEPAPDSFGTLLAVGGFPGPPAVAMFRTNVVRGLGGIRAGLEANADYDLFLRVAEHHPLYCHHSTVCEYRRHSRQRTKDSALMLRSVMTVLQRHREYVQANPCYARSYREAHHRFQASYGESLLWETIEAVKIGRIRQAVPRLLTLLRWYPMGLWRVVRHRLHRMIQLSRPQRHIRSQAAVSQAAASMQQPEGIASVDDDARLR